MSRTSTIMLLTGDYADRLNALYAEAMRLERSEDTETLLNGEVSAYERVREQYEALKAEAEEQGVKVVLRSLGRRAWRDLKVKHPPRLKGAEGVDDERAAADRAAGVNVDTVEDDLVYASLIEPEFSSRAAFDEWADDLAEGDFKTIVLRAWSLVNVAAVDPKSLPASLTRRSDAN